MNVIEKNTLTNVTGGMIGAPAGSYLLSSSGESSSSCSQIEVGFPGGVNATVGAWIGCASEIASAAQSIVSDISSWWNQAQPVFPYGHPIHQQATEEMLHDFGPDVGQGGWTVG
jgi:hypothetical protein